MDGTGWKLTVTCGISNAYEEETIILLCQPERFRCPHLPGHRITCMSAYLFMSFTVSIHLLSIAHLAMCGDTYIRTPTLAQPIDKLQLFPAIGKCPFGLLPRQGRGRGRGHLPDSSPNLKVEGVVQGARCQAVGLRCLVGRSPVVMQPNEFWERQSS